ncbi:hypothetical protein R3P38DRAFT_2566222 [Favolaschia claudopus]|uniref:Protein kinase domain-containing protein n=3 Tax=Favolaschia claudopus TaxID=2862362 RepID=A0AAV9ZY98_9AGAR
MSERPSAILRCRLQPQRIAISNLPSRNTGFTGISEGQIVQAEQLSVPSRWSMAPDMSANLIASLEDDLDLLLPQHPTLQAALTRATHALADNWSVHFGDQADIEYDQQETATGDASRFLLHTFATVAFRAIQTAAAPIGSTAALKFRPKLAAPTASSFIIDNAICLNSASDHLMGMEDKRASVLPWAVKELSRRGLSCGVVDVETEAPKHQPNWWIIANKGALYSAAYNMDWVIYGGMTVYCVGHRVGRHMLWSSFYNRRDIGDEVTPHTAENVAKVFGHELPAPGVQTGLPLLAMAVILKGILSSGSCPWLSQMFPLLSALVFALPSGNPDVEEFTNYGRDHGDSSDESSSDSGNDGDPSGDFIPRGVLDTRFPPVTQLSAVNTIVIAKHKFTGNWLGELGESSGQSIEIISRLSEGRHGIVYTGILTRHSRVVAKVAVKASDDKLRLLAEFSRYKELQDLMGSYLPRCHGICITSRSAFLITSFVQDQGQKSKLTKAERCTAIYICLTFQ